MRTSYRSKGQELAFGLALLAVVSAASPPALHAQTVSATFDDLPTVPVGHPFGSVPGGYADHNWFRGDGAFGAGDALEYTTGANNNVPFECLSSPNCAYNSFGNVPIRVESLTQTAGSAFTFSGYFEGGYPSFGTGPYQVEVQGFQGTDPTAVFTSYFTVPESGYTLESFTSLGVNKLLFTPEDASGVPSDWEQGYLRLDDVTFNPGTYSAPEPSTTALLGTGMAGLFPLMRRRRRR